MYPYSFLIAASLAAAHNIQAQETILKPNNKNPNIIEGGPGKNKEEIELKTAPEQQPEEEKKPVKKPSVEVFIPPPPPINQNDLMQHVIDEQLEALREFDPSQAYYAYTSSDFQKAISLDAFKRFVKSNNALFDNKNFVLQNVVYSGVIATVKGVITLKNGKAVRVDYDMIQENGVWKIRKINILSQ